jgi:hypothetical protein
MNHLWMLNQLVRLQKYGESEHLKHMILTQPLSRQDIENLLYITRDVPAMKTHVICRAARQGFNDLCDDSITLGDVMISIRADECKNLHKLTSLLGDNTQKDLLANWPVYRKYIMERFSVLRNIGYIPDAAFLINEWLGI